MNSLRWLCSVATAYATAAAVKWLIRSYGVYCCLCLLSSSSFSLSCLLVSTSHHRNSYRKVNTFERLLISKIEWLDGGRATYHKNAFGPLPYDRLQNSASLKGRAFRKKERLFRIKFDGNKKRGALVFLPFSGQRRAWRGLTDTPTKQ